MFIYYDKFMFLNTTFTFSSTKKTLIGNYYILMTYFYTYLGYTPRCEGIIILSRGNLISGIIDGLEQVN